MLDRGRTDEKADAARRERTVAIAEELVAQLGHMKGAAMKVGQVLSTIDFPALAPEDRDRIKERLAALRDQAPSVPFKRLEKLMAQEWGEPVARVLAEIDPEPVAAASIGQVHRGRTHSGRDVAVKVQYPGIAEAVESDMRNLRMLLPLVRRLAPGLDGKALADELRERVSEECDYELEAQSQRTIARGWRNHPFVRVPDVDTEHSTRRVLVTDFVDGEPWAAIKEREEPVRDRVAEIMYRFFHGTVRRMDIAMGDPHPGNYLLTPDGGVCFLDFGLVRQLPPGHQEREAKVVLALQAQDPKLLLEVLDGLGYVPHGTDLDPQVLFEQMWIQGWWLVGDEPQPIRLRPKIAYEMMELLSAPGAPYIEAMRKMTLPAEALLLRRMENVLFSAFVDLRAAADWRALCDELVLGAPPRTELGLVEAQWLAAAR